jgi:Mrp family chromosome partitioning ATPase
MPANVLAACDAAVLLVQQGHTPVSMAASAIERLRSGGTDVLGCLVTGVGGPAT